MTNFDLSVDCFGRASERVCERAGVRADGHVRARAGGRAYGRACGCVSVRVSERACERVGGLADMRACGCASGFASLWAGLRVCER